MHKKHCFLVHLCCFSFTFYENSSEIHDFYIDIAWFIRYNICIKKNTYTKLCKQGGKRMFRRKWRMTSVIMLICFLLCSCGSEAESKSTAENSSAVEITPLDQIQMNYQNNPYFDVLDLTYVGTYEQKFANGAGFENPEDNDPVFVWKKYVSSDGETFCFDDQGRLRKYKNAFYSNPGGDFEENKTNGTRASAKMKSAAKIEKISEDIAENYMVTEEAVRVEPYDGNGSYIIKNAETRNASEDETVAIVDLDAYGEIEWFTASYEIQILSELYDYFNQKIDDYIAEKKQISDIVDYTCEPRYEQVENKVYAIYTLTYEDSIEAYFCEIVGFTKEIETDDSRGDVKE